MSTPVLTLVYFITLIAATTGAIVTIRRSGDSHASRRQRTIRAIVAAGIGFGFGIALGHRMLVAYYSESPAMLAIVLVAGAVVGLGIWSVLRSHPTEQGPVPQLPIERALIDLALLVPAVTSALVLELLMTFWIANQFITDWQPSTLLSGAHGAAVTAFSVVLLLVLVQLVTPRLRARSAHLTLHADREVPSEA